MNAGAKWVKWLTFAGALAVLLPVSAILSPIAFGCVLVLGVIYGGLLFTRALVATFPKAFDRKHERKRSLPVLLALVVVGTSPDNAEAAVYPGESVPVCVGMVGAQYWSEECNMSDVIRQCSECGLGLLTCGAAIGIAIVTPRGPLKTLAILAAYGTCGFAAWQCSDCYAAAYNCDAEDLINYARDALQEIEDMLEELDGDGDDEPGN